MAGTTTVPTLFKEDFICPHCTGRDYGRFCSHCGGMLVIAAPDVMEMAAQRLVALGYSRLENDRGQATGALAKLAAGHFTAWNATMLEYDLTFVHSAEIVVLANLSNAPLDRLQEHIDAFAAEIRATPEAILGTEGMTNVSLRVALFAFETKEVDALRDKLARLSGTGPLGSRGRFWKREKAALKWRTDIVDVESATVYQSSRLRFDAIAHELRVSAKQAGAVTSGEDTETDYSIVSFFTALTGEIVNYFAILLAFVQNRFVFADLIVNKRYPAERIVGYYVIGIGVSVLLPYALTLGRVGPAELLSFGNLPPILDELAELGMDTAFIVLQASLLHASFRILKHRGKLMLSVVSLLFVNAFFQIIDRPAGYLYGLALSSELETGTSLRLIGNFEQYIKWPLYAFCIFPFTTLIYRAGMKTTAKAFTMAAIATLAVVSPFLVQPFFEIETIKDFNAVLTSDRAIAGEFEERVMPLLTRGDQTGDYRPAVAILDPLISSLRQQKGKMLALKDRSWGVCAGRLQSACAEMHQVLELRVEAFENIRALVTATSDNAAHDRIKDIGERLQTAIKRLNDALDTANRLAG